MLVLRSSLILRLRHDTTASAVLTGSICLILSFQVIENDAAIIGPWVTVRIAMGTGTGMGMGMGVGVSVGRIEHAFATSATASRALEVLQSRRHALSETVSK